MHHRSLLFGLCALFVGVGNGLGTRSAVACERHLVSQATDTGQVTVIPGNKSSDRPVIDYQGALPLPLPSADPPKTQGDTPARLEPGRNPPGVSSPGSRGSGEQHPEILPGPARR